MTSTLGKFVCFSSSRHFQQLIITCLIHHESHSHDHTGSESLNCNRIFNFSRNKVRCSNTHTRPHSWSPGQLISDCDRWVEVERKINRLQILSLSKLPWDCYCFLQSFLQSYVSEAVFYSQVVCIVVKIRFVKSSINLFFRYHFNLTCFNSMIVAS